MGKRAEGKVEEKQKQDYRRWSKTASYRTTRFASSHPQPTSSWVLRLQDDSRPAATTELVAYPCLGCSCVKVPWRRAEIGNVVNSA